MREEASVFFYCVKTVAVNHWVFALSNFVRVGRNEYYPVPNKRTGTF